MVRKYWTNQRPAFGVKSLEHDGILIRWVGWGHGGWVWAWWVMGGYSYGGWVGGWGMEGGGWGGSMVGSG